MPGPPALTTNVWALHVMKKKGGGREGDSLKGKELLQVQQLPTLDENRCRE